MKQVSLEWRLRPYGGHMSTPDALVEDSGGHIVAIANNLSGDAEANGRLIAAAPEMLEALMQSKRLFEEALPKFNWGASALDANAIKLLNEVPMLVDAAIGKAGRKL